MSPQLHAKNASFDLHLRQTNTITSSDEIRISKSQNNSDTAWDVGSAHKELYKLDNTGFKLDLQP